MASRRDRADMNNGDHNVDNNKSNGDNESHGDEESPGDEEKSNKTRRLVHFAISGVGACNLKRGLFFNPDPYVKFRISPGKTANWSDPLSKLESRHGQRCRTRVRRNTVDPCWDNEEFQFVADFSDLLEIEVKDKFAKSRPTISRNLGRLAIPIEQLLKDVKPKQPVHVAYSMAEEGHVAANSNLRFTITRSPFAGFKSEETSGKKSGESGSKKTKKVCSTKSSSSILLQPPNPNQSSGSPSPTSPFASELNLPRKSLPVAQQQVVVVDRRRRSYDNKMGVVRRFATPVMRSCKEENEEEVRSSSLSPRPLRRRENATLSQTLTLSSTSVMTNSTISVTNTSTGLVTTLTSSVTTTTATSCSRRSQTLPRSRTPELVSNSVKATPVWRRKSSSSLTTDPNNEESPVRKSPRRTARNNDENSATELIFGSMDSLPRTAPLATPDEDHTMDTNMGESNEHFTFNTNAFPSPPNEPEDQNRAMFNLEVTPPPDSFLINGRQHEEPPSTEFSYDLRRLRLDTNQMEGNNETLDENAQMDEDNESSNVRGVLTRLPSIPECNNATVAIDDTLPPNWEAREDSHGRIFYIDHTHHTTTWQRPSTSATESETMTSATMNSEMSDSNEGQRQLDAQRQLQLDQRYQRIRRTITDDAIDAGNSNDSNVCSNDNANNEGAVGQQGQQHRAAYISPERQRQLILNGPIVQFLLRPDLIQLVQQHEHLPESQLIHRSSVRHMLSRIRRDPLYFERYQHNRDLVALLNMFAVRTKELPSGWESKKDRNGKTFYIDHMAKTTTFIDPRLPNEWPLITEPQPTSLLAPDDPSSPLLPPPPPRHRRSNNTLMPPNNNNANNSSSGDTLSVDSTINRRQRSRSVGDDNMVENAQQNSRQTLAYPEKVVQFLRQPQVWSILRQRQPSLINNRGLREKVTAVRQDGKQALQRLSNDLEFTMLLSLFEHEIMTNTNNLHRSSNRSCWTGPPSPSSPSSPLLSPGAATGVNRSNARPPAPYKRDFEAKLRVFYRRLEAEGYGQGPTKMKLTIRRDHLLEDAFRQIMCASRKELAKCRIHVQFDQEEGLDYGGIAREFFFLVSREVFNPYYGLFEYSANDTYTVQISPLSAFVDHNLVWFRFCGRILGLALVHQFLIDVFFTRHFYKALLQLPVSLCDLESLDASFHQSLVWLSETEIEDPEQLGMTFSVTEELFGERIERDLKANGRNISVTESNKKEYITKIIKWRLERGVTPQRDALLKGFYEVIDSKVLAIFDARELELVIAGTAEIDVIDWRRNTEYRSGYSDDHAVIQWFWDVIERRFDNEQRLRLLQFVTGTSSVPYEGFAALRGSNGPRKFCIEQWGKPQCLPRAHTCFNRMDLPPYASAEQLFEKLLLAVEETSSFGIE